MCVKYKKTKTISKHYLNGLNSDAVAPNPNAITRAIVLMRNNGVSYVRPKKKVIRSAWKKDKETLNNSSSFDKYDPASWHSGPEMHIDPPYVKTAKRILDKPLARVDRLKETYTLSAERKLKQIADLKRQLMDAEDEHDKLSSRLDFINGFTTDEDTLTIIDWILEG